MKLMLWIKELLDLSGATCHTWSECVEIGVGSESTGAYPTLYFAKDYLTDGQLAEMSKTQINDRLIRIGYREDVYEDALQYADKSIVKDFRVV